MIPEVDVAMAEVSTSTAARVVSVAAPDGSGREAAETGWVAWKNVPVTGVVGIDAILTGCVTPEPLTGNAPETNVD